MAVNFGRIRHVALATIGAGSILAGLFFAFRLVTPALLVQLPTPELMGLLGLLVLPPLTAWALWADRSAAAKLPVPLQLATDAPLNATDDAEAADLASDSDVQLVAEQIAEPEVHAPGRRSVRHRRHDPARVAP